VTFPLKTEDGLTLYIGTPDLLRMLDAGLHTSDLFDFAQLDMTDATMLMRLSMLFNLLGHAEMARDMQDRALKITPFYHLAASAPARIRLLAILKPGYLQDNTPLEFLLENSDVALDFVYVSPDLPLPASLPEYDLAFVAISQVEAHRACLAQVRTLMRGSPRPILNFPAEDGMLERDRVSVLLQSLPGLEAPLSHRIDRDGLLGMIAGQAPPGAVPDDCAFPVIVRPFGSQAGKGLARIDHADAIAAYLQERPEQSFSMSRFIDYRSADGQYRKYRIVFIDGKPFICHLAIAAHWIVHYQTAGMEQSADKRAEEASCMQDFETDFCRRHGPALLALAGRIGLDYLVIDCAETGDGKLLFFEADNIAIVHAMDDADLYPYKQVQMRKVFLAFRQMLARRIA
jgi:hypothetical protein